MIASAIPPPGNRTKRMESMADTLEYNVPGMSCAHCKAAITEEVEAVEGVRGVEVDLETKKVVVRGDALDDSAIREAIVEAGYEAAA
jgi:copper chaperone